MGSFDGVTHTTHRTFSTCRHDDHCHGYLTVFGADCDTDSIRQLLSFSHCLCSELCPGQIAEIYKANQKYILSSCPHPSSVNIRSEMAELEKNGLEPLTGVYP